MQKINIKEQLNKLIFLKNISYKKQDYIITTTKKTENKKYQASKLIYKNYNKALFQSAKFSLQIIFLNKKIDLANALNLSPKLLIVNQLILKSTDLISKFPYLTINTFKYLNLITNNLNILLPKK